LHHPYIKLFLKIVHFGQKSKKKKVFFSTPALSLF